ncbi:MAG: MlaD family protein [Opitutaceae bacterium]|nr:MlaD family protein [Opitutaceae bacterium]
MNSTQQTVRVGLFFLLGLALAWITFESLSGGRFFKEKGYTVIAPFSNLKGLKNGDEVLMAGVKVGSVFRTRLGHQRVEAVLTIDPGVKIPNDAVASVQQSSLLGSNHLEVGFGTPGAPLIKDGDEIKTQDTVDMNQVIAQLGALGSKLEQVAGDIGKALGGGGQSASLFNKLDTLVTETGPRFEDAVSNLQDITAKIKNGEGTIGRLVNDAQLHDELLAGVTEIRNAAAQASSFAVDAKAITEQIRSGQGTIGALVFDQKAGDDIRVVARNLREISDKLNSGQGTFGRLMTDDTLYREAQGLVKKADRALDSMGDSGPITAVGVVANQLF